MKKITLLMLCLCIALALAACKPGGEQDSTTSESSATNPGSNTTAEPGNGKAYEFEFDPYALSWEYHELYGDEFVEMYKGFVDAYMNFETTFSCPSEDMFAALFGAIKRNMPYFESDAYLTFDCYDLETKTGQIFYNSGSAQEHERKIDAFVGEVTDIILGCVEKDDNELEKAAALYQEFSSSVLYDGNIAEENISPYYAIMQKKGVSQSLAGAYAYLLRQAGVEANTCSGLTQDSMAAHEWCILKINGKYYYADPTYENGETGGLGLSYFGITTSERQEAGGFNPSYFSIGTTGLVFGDEYDVSDTRFSALRGCYYFTLDRENNRIVYWVTGDEQQKHLEH
jgi:hypothetical protein